jgi:OFA family oxalate/formate antiporter-like MFS transporter
MDPLCRPDGRQTLLGQAAIQLAFSIFIVTESWLVPVEGWLVDRFGPRPVVIGGSTCAALGWVLDAYAPRLPVLYAAGVLAGIGAGCVYGTCVGTALKWFPDKRGLAAGLTAALTVIPISNMIQRSGYQHAFVFFGLFQGVCILLLATLLVRPKPPAHAAGAKRIVATKTDYTAKQMVRSPLFWVMYAMFVYVAAGGIIATAQIGPIAKEYGFAAMPVSALSVTLPLLTMTLSINNMCNGFTRPLCGFISDRIGRENTMFMTFVGEGLALLGLVHFGHNPYLFMMFSGLVFMCYGDIFSNFPATCADTFGGKYAAGNRHALYRQRDRCHAGASGFAVVRARWTERCLRRCRVHLDSGRCVCEAHPGSDAPAPYSQVRRGKCNHGRRRSTVACRLARVSAAK